MLFNLIHVLLAYLPQDEEGQGMAEYGLILALIAVVVIVAMGLVGTNLNTLFTSLAGDLTTGGTTP